MQKCHTLENSVAFSCVQPLHQSDVKAVLSGNGLTLPLQMRVLSLLVRSVLTQACGAEWLCKRVGESSAVGTDDDFQEIA